MEHAQDHVKRDPGERQPARPIVAAEHESSTENRQEPDELDPDAVELKRISDVEIGDVVDKADCAYGYIHASEDGHGERALISRFLF